MAQSERRQYGEAQNVALTSQVDGVCPRCDKPLFYKKSGKSFKAYEIAHIYPLNPSPQEIKLLKDEERLSEDVNDEDNLIPLCKSCHGKFDKPRTVEEYRQLVEIKKRLIARSGQELLWSSHHLESDIRSVIEALYEENFVGATAADIEYEPTAIDEKVDDSITRPTVRKIKNNVSDYFTLIKTHFSEIDKANPNFSDIVSLQIKTYFLKQQQLGVDKQAIFDNLVSWVNVKTKPKSIDAAEILVSFFVQNCEVF
ncbi:MAG TPA: ABC-three component system protein [Marinobacter sp.]|uniref:ABC-three component system protein n=1 Tax=Marinobacter sp. TaxID=50741 RepID=UPI002D7F290F|nr:ABC-three component system protein [Marinobacter sp.]HET8801067.1 ABC-three component system protein [Marinobacter sp.]